MHNVRAYTFWFLQFYISAYTTLNELLAVFLYIIFAVLLKFERSLKSYFVHNNNNYYISICRTSNVIHMPNFVQICAIVNELWATDKIQNGGRRHLEFIIFVDFGQMVYFRWQPVTSLQNFIYLRQSAAELLMFVQNPLFNILAYLHVRPPG